MKCNTTLWLVFCMLCRKSSSLNILAIFAYEGKSHNWVFSPIVRGLVDRGHQVTTLIHHSLNINNQNYSEILLNRGVNSESVLDLNNAGFSFISPRFSTLNAMSMTSCHQVFSTPEVKQLIESELKFDILLTELFSNECGLAFKDIFEIPNVVGISTTYLLSWYYERFGQPSNLVYFTSNEIWPAGKHLSFIQRLENVLSYFSLKIFYNGVVMKNNQEISEKYLSRKLSPFHETMKKISVVLVNSHWSLFYPVPEVPAVVNIGGIHVPKAKKLPLNIEKFINESTHGVIYFSLGSMIKGHTFPQEKREEFLKAFARLPQRVLWKWENETMPGKPDNVMIQKWMPQFDILSHPNVKAFISHGGLLGVTEAVHCGVPMMVMPQYGDQHTNAKAVEANGGGVILYLRDATEEKVYQNLKTILDPEFREKAKALSERFRDRPMSPMDTAIYWVEYVARHKGAPHLRTAAVDMPLYQYLLLDVFAFLAAVLLVSLYVTYKISSLIFRSIFSKKKVKQS